MGCIVSANFQKMAREAHLAMNDHAVHQTEKNRLRILARAFEEAFQLGVESVRRGREQSALLAGLPLPPVLIIDAKGHTIECDQRSAPGLCALLDAEFPGDAPHVARSLLGHEAEQEETTS